MDGYYFYRKYVNDYKLMTCLVLVLSCSIARADPDINGDEGQGKSVFIHQRAINYYTWTGVVVGIIFFAVVLCLVASWIYSCRINRRRREGGVNQTSNVPKVFVLHPPSYVSHDPPSYSAPDFFKINEEYLQAQNIDGKRNRRGKQRGTISLVTNTTTTRTNNQSGHDDNSTQSGHEHYNQIINQQGTSVTTGGQINSVGIHVNGGSTLQTDVITPTPRVYCEQTTTIQDPSWLGTDNRGCTCVHDEPSGIPPPTYEDSVDSSTTVINGTITTVL